MVSKDIDAKTERRSRFYSVISIVLAIVPFIICLILFILLALISNGTFFEGVGGGLWPVFLIAAIVTAIVHIIVSILAVIFGILAVIKHRTLFSWIGIIIVAVEILIVAVI